MTADVATATRISEEWRPIAWKDGLEYPAYSVSNLGYVRREISRFGHISVRQLKGWVGPGGYVYVGFGESGPPRKNRAPVAVHRLVAWAFLGPQPEGLEPNHIDGDKTNNAVTNLEWLSRSDNHRHAYRLGLRKHRGYGTPRSHLTETDVIAIRQSEESTRGIARRYGVRPYTIRLIRLRQTWRHVS